MENRDNSLKEPNWADLMNSPSDRRAFLARMGAVGLGAAAATLLAAGCGSGSGTLPNTSTSATTGGTVGTVLDPTNFPGVIGRSEDEVVLNYALTLEILEADLYRQALNLAAGRPVASGLDATPPPSGSTGAYSQKVGNGSVSAALAPAGFLYLVQYAYVEAAHRDFLRVVLQSLGAPVTQPNPKGYTAPFGTDLGSILSLLYAVEEEGTRAYLGAAGFLTNTTLLTTAVAIYSTECRHSSGLAYILGKDTGPLYTGGGDKRVTDGAQAPNPAPYGQNTFQYYRDPVTVLGDVKPFFK